MDFLFNLGQHCEGRQGIDFWGGACKNQNKLVLLRLHHGLWHQTAYTSKTQCKSASKKIRLSSKSPEASHLSSDEQYCILFSLLGFGNGKKKTLWYSSLTEPGSCRRLLSNTELLPTRHTQRSGCWQAEVVCCFKRGDNCPYLENGLRGQASSPILNSGNVFSLRQEEQVGHNTSGIQMCEKVRNLSALCKIAKLFYKCLKWSCHLNPTAVWKQ